jgi:hypothetical protein
VKGESEFIFLFSTALSIIYLRKNIPIKIERINSYH